MKKVVLVGDSICEWYSQYVEKELEGVCEVIYSNEQNGRFAAFSLRKLNDLIVDAGGKVDLVHFNNGYWDMGPLINGERVHPIPEYLHFLKRIINLSRFAGAKVVFATTTPLVDAVTAEDNMGTGVVISARNETVIEYNNAAKALMKTEGVTVNDLYELCIKHPQCYKCEDMLHHSHEGNLACAKAIAEAIKKELGIE